MATTRVLVLGALVVCAWSNCVAADGGSPRFEFKLIADDGLPAEMGVFVDCSDCEHVRFKSDVTNAVTLKVERRPRVALTAAEIEFLRVGEGVFPRDPARRYWIVEAVPEGAAWKRFLAVRDAYPLARVLVLLEGRAQTIDNVGGWNAGIVLTKVAERTEAEALAKDLRVEIRVVVPPRGGG